MSNFLSNPTLECIQAMLVFLSTLLNMYNAGVSWAMDGLCIRLAQTLGLHQTCRSNTPIPVQNERAKTWWAIIWQDSLISITYDRAGSVPSIDGNCRIPPEFNSEPGSWGFERCMYKLCCVGLTLVHERLQSRDNPQAVLRRMHEHEREIRVIELAAEPKIRSLEECRTFPERIQFYIFHLHKHYIISEVCRPAISPASPPTELASCMRSRGIESLQGTVQSWLGLFQESELTTRSWPAMHRALSSALVLGLMKESQLDHKVQWLLSEFLCALEQITGELRTDEIAPPLQRSMHWLKKLISSRGQHDSTDSSPIFPEMGPGVSPHTFMAQLMWQNTER